MKKFFNKKNIVILLLIIVVVILIAFVSYKLLVKEQPQEEPSIQLSPYTLEEIYEIVEQPEKFNELTGGTSSPFSYTVFHFYDYFSKTTPIKIATEVEKDEHGRVVKVLEVDYVTYEEYMKMFDEVFEMEKEDLEVCERASEEAGEQICDINFSYFNYGYWVRKFVYEGGWEAVIYK